MADYEDHDLLVGRHTSSKKDRHRRKKHRARVQPEYHEDLVEGLRQSHDAWTGGIRERHAEPQEYEAERRSRSASASPVKRSRNDDVMGQVQKELATQLHRQEQLHASMEKLLDRQRILAQQLVERDEKSRKHIERIDAVVQGMAPGEGAEPGPRRTPRESWHGEQNAGTLPRLPEEITYKDGLLTWTEENVGELLACIAYKHLITVKDETDNEEAGENASEIKQAAMAHGVDGRALLHLTIEDMEKIGETAGTVEGGGECALTQVGHRIAILSSLHAFRDAHAHEKWDVVKELPLLTNQGQNRKEGEALLTEELCKTYGVDKIQGDNSDKALKGAMVHKSTKKKGPKREEVVVPVFATLLMKKITEDTDGNLSMIGTFIQRPLLYDLKAFDRESGFQPQPYFEMRVNEGESKDCFELRKTARDLSAGPKMDRDKNGKDETGYFATAASTFVATMPLKLDSVYNEPPFNIMSATVMVELTSFIGTNALNEKFELRPSFVSHASDLRNLCSVRDWKDDYKMDEMKRWELVTPMPTIEYEYDGGKGKKSLYVPKVRLTYYLFEEAIQPIIETVMPIIFAFVANTYNILNSFKEEEREFKDYLANNVGIGLTIVFIVPTLSKSDAFDAEWKWNYVYVVWIFAALVLSLPAYLVKWQEPLFDIGSYGNVTAAHLVILFQWLSLSIPLYNGCVWYWIMRKIKSNWIHKRDLSMTFLGRPGSISDWKRKHEHLGSTAGKDANKKGSQGALDKDLRTFVVKTGDDKKPKIELNPDILTHAAQATTYTQAGSAKRGRFEPWQFDAENQYIYCGLHRNYYQDKEVKRKVDNNEHNMPYQRKLRHEPLRDDS
jgi:hypothetical protein